MIGIGVIGCGKIAQVRHLPEYAANQDAKIIGVFDLCRERAEETALQYDARAYTSYEDILSNPAIMAVSICTANSSHCEIAVKAMLAGKHVLCEKPMAITPEECLQMVNTARKTGKFLMIGQNQRLAAAHTQAKQLIEQGVIGKILTFRTSFSHAGPESWTIDRNHNWFFDKKTAAFGVLADLGIHKTDLIHYLTDHIITQVFAYAGTLDKKTMNGEPASVEDNAVCLYRMDNGITGTMTVSWSNYGKEDNSTVLYGTDGVMYLYTDPVYSLIVEKKDGTRILYESGEIQTNDKQTSSGIIDLWIQCLINQVEPDITGKAVLPAMNAVFAALDSAETGTLIQIGNGGD